VGPNPPYEINANIEVPLRSDPIKYEFDKSAGAIVVDRFLYTTMFYPCNHGFIPHTLAEDGDAVDVMEMGRIPVLPGVVRPARPVGVLRMRDEAGGTIKSWRCPSPGSPDCGSACRPTATVPRSTSSALPISSSTMFGPGACCA
jgi:inorganic pyrophosphatase